ncbi:MAG: DHH family phosphoesterase [Minisyncoccales bacterium]
MEIKNLKEASERIKKAIFEKENIILYSDSDIDGITSCLILEETLVNLNYQPTRVFFPNRNQEGYGLQKKVLEIISDYRSGLLVLLDCGISNFQEIEIAREKGFFVLIIDHHEVIEHLPHAHLIVNPKQKDDQSPFKYLSNAGIVFKLTQEILQEKMNQCLRGNFLELVALSTLADMMPEIEENKIFIKEGLEHLENSWRPSFQFLKKIIRENTNSQRMFAFKIISLLNMGETVDHLNESYLFLKEWDEEKLKEMLKKFEERVLERQVKIKEIVQTIEKRIIKKLKNPIIFEGDKDWPLTLTGVIASRLCSKFEKPTFIFKINEKESLGSMRTPPQVNGIEAMKKTSQFLESFGGHPQAGGFKIKNENLEEFKKSLIKIFQKS